MTYSFLDAPPNLGSRDFRGDSCSGSPLKSQVLCTEPDRAVLSALGAEELELEWLETPRAWCRLIEQADACFEHARIAEIGLRFSAAYGLILTAQELLRRSLNIRCSTTEHLALERAANERLDTTRCELERLLDLSVQVHLFVI